MADHDHYAALLDTVVRPLLTEPDEFAVRAKRNKTAVAVEFKVAPADTGRVIGRGGATIRSIRAALEFAGERNEDRVSVELLEA